MEWNDRVGIIRIDEELVRKDTEMAAKILARLKFVPTRTEYIHHEGVFEYEGMSPLFDIIAPYEEAKEYRLEVTGNDIGGFAVAVVEVTGS
ncbi:MAG: hypothetical protein JW724_03255 [Candidatus Altiarchaeota archaeon]|nr:hypothetical protein [Candidatus Altiarchaeota archaeon]